MEEDLLTVGQACKEYSLPMVHLNAAIGQGKIKTVLRFVSDENKRHKRLVHHIWRADLLEFLAEIEVKPFEYRFIVFSPSKGPPKRAREDDLKAAEARKRIELIQLARELGLSVEEIS